MQIGTHYVGDGHCHFVVWAPGAEDVCLRVVSPTERLIPMKKDPQGYWRTEQNDCIPGACYFYRLGRTIDRPDPASYYQPEGVHGPSQVIDHTIFQWQDQSWSGIPLEEMIIYELHVGTFTPEGTFQATISRLRELKKTGITTIEIMPVAQFPGERNWGYDGVYPFAVQNSYGGPNGLKQLVNACHAHDMAVILDVVYNHLGPEGNYLWDFGPYFTDKYRTPWGPAINFDDANSDQVRNFFIENALYWFETYHIDALRLDAIHGIFDMSAKHILAELAEKSQNLSNKLGRKFYLIAENDLNDPMVIRPQIQGGYGIDAQWNDDFHHCIHTLLTGERTGYYQDFGSIEDLATSLREGFIYSWKYSRYRKRRYGNSSNDLPAGRFLVFSQNHDQVGNRMHGDRLSGLVSFEALKLAAGTVILSPYIPLFFMGEEYAEAAPFLYFFDHSNPVLVAAVREGRARKFDPFAWNPYPPDPAANSTFIQSKLSWQKRNSGRHSVILSFYRKLIQLRKQLSALAHLDKTCLKVTTMAEHRFIMLHRWHGSNEIFCMLNFNQKEVTVCPCMSVGNWIKMLDSADETWNGPGSVAPKRIVQGVGLTTRPLSVILYKKTGSRVV